MKNLAKLLILSLVLVFVYVGCAKEPTQEINDAKAAIDAAAAEGAQTYSPDQLRQLNDDYNGAVDLAKATTGKLFKSNDEAKQKLIKVKADAEAVKAEIPAKKAAAKAAAETALAEAKTATEEAKVLVTKAPKGKGQQADIEAFNADLTALDGTIAEVQKLIDTEDYFGASDKAKTIKEKAAGISEQINAAIEKVGAQKKGKKK
ncbi:MAG TPA: hypothetical protein VK469_02405 [Candidatus Kapabacteria bacterium]|nr:hypothetical protein [Candidatus Kapabacteria bacterium]